MKRNALMLLAGLLATGLIAAGCGGDDDDDGGDGGEALTKEEYLAQGNAICDKANAELQATFETLGDEQPTKQELDNLTTETLVPNVQGQIDELRDLPAPEGDEETLNSLYDDAQAALDRIKDDPSLATGQGGADPFAEVNQQAVEYGLTACGAG